MQLHQHSLPLNQLEWTYNAPIQHQYPYPSHGGTVDIPTDIAIEPPDGTYASLASRISLAFKSNVHVIGGFIDPDYRGNVKVGLINNGD